jgi:hypothetical protein
MIGKTVKGNGFGGVLRHVFEKLEAQYIGGNMSSSTPLALVSEFRAIASHNHRLKRSVAHMTPPKRATECPSLSPLHKTGFTL